MAAVTNCSYSVLVKNNDERKILSYIGNITEHSEQRLMKECKENNLQSGRQESRRLSNSETQWQDPSDLIPHHINSFLHRVNQLNAVELTSSFERFTRKISPYSATWAGIAQSV